MNDRIKVISSPTGSGKTTYILKYINELPDETKVIFITPFLTEVDRVKEACSKKKFVAPDKRLGGGAKRNHFLQLIKADKNIVSTHSLFAGIDAELITEIKKRDYILVLDEVMDVLDKFDLWDEDYRISEKEKETKTREEIKTLLAKQAITIDDDTGQIYWIDDAYQWGKYETFKNLAKRGLLFFINGSVIVWTFPIEVFQEEMFSEVFILTFQFDYQIQACYYKYFDLEYGLYHIENKNNQYELVKTKDNQYELDWIIKVKPLIKIVDNERLNRIGTHESKQMVREEKSIPLTMTWYDQNEWGAGKMGKNLINFFSHYANAPSKERMWTCFVQNKKEMMNNYATKKNWIPINSRATNLYINKKALAYTINRYLNPYIINFFKKKGVDLDQDKFALSEMIQWIWRSAIRNNEEITIYIPSHRMRTLLEKYLNNEEIKYN